MTNRGYTEMTISLLEKSPEAGKLLAQLHDRHQLYQLAKNPEPTARGELATIMTELLEIDLSNAEKEIITDVLMELVRQAEVDLRQALAERLSVLEAAPLRMILHLANDEISVADPILRKSRALTDMDLIYIIRGKSTEYWQAIAQRPKMNEQLINSLVATNDFSTAVNLAENKNIKLARTAIEGLSRMAENSERIARPLLTREEMPNELVKHLYHFVGKELKEYIKSEYKELSNEIGKIVDDVMLEFSDVHAENYTPTMTMITTAENMLSKNFLNPDIMIENLRRGQISNFVAMFSVYCGLPIDVVHSMLLQKTAQGLAVACRAVGVLKTDFINMFLLTSRLRGGNIINQAELARALDYFDKIEEKMARNILNQSRH